jgi:hypothetical protein
MKVGTSQTEEWLHRRITAEGRGVPCEVLEGVVGSDGDRFVRESVPGGCPPLSVKNSA